MILYNLNTGYADSGWVQSLDWTGLLDWTGMNKWLKFCYIAGYYIKIHLVKLIRTWLIGIMDNNTFIM